VWVALIFDSTIDMAQLAVLTVSFALRLSVVWAGFFTFCALARADAPIKFLTGPAFNRQLEQPVTIAWSNVSFREAIASLSESQSLAVVIDRRIDADHPFSMQVTGDPLRIVIAKIAERKGIGSSVLGSIVYFGPKNAAESLKTLAAMRRDDVLKFAPGLKKLLAQSRPIEWDDLAEPRQLITALAKEARVNVEGIAKVPHDLWPANRLPSLPWCDRMTLLLIPFGLTYQVAEDGRSISIIPIPEAIEVTRKYSGGTQTRTRAKKIGNEFPNAKVSLEGEKIVVIGRMEDQDAIAELLGGGKTQSTTVKAGEKVYKLNIEGLPLEKVLSQLSGMLKLELKYDHEAIQAAGISLNQLITFRVENASLDELLTAALKETGLKFERQDKLVTVTVR
jgi:hypothetical protein